MAARTARIAVDIGGTFTDVVLDHDGELTTAKVLTTHQGPELAAFEGIERVLDETGVAPDAIGLLLHGTTLATNAVIERKGAVTALITTKGFRDVLEIADEGRFDQYDIFLEKPAPLVPRERRLPVPERIDVDGKVITPLDEDAVRALLPELERLGVESVAVGFLHAYANDAHERRVAELIHAARPDLPVTLSSEVCPEVREYERFSTAVANAYVQPLMASYLERLERGARERGLDCPLLLMTSGGGLTTVANARAQPIRLIESGPAGGAILSAGIAKAGGYDRVLSFDMGGTTAKICLIDHGVPHSARSFEVDRRARFTKGSGLPLRIPVIDMVEIGAGGGSIARVDAARRLTIGPDSAGSEPGPACYGRGGADACITDADLLLGRLDPDEFAGGRMTLDTDAALQAVRQAVGAPLDLDDEDAAFAISEMVDETMASAARVHAVERGSDLRDRTLIAFGGAAPNHAARLARKLGIARIVIPAGAGVGSAVGFLRASVAYEVVRSRYLRLSAFEPDVVNALMADMIAEARTVVEPGAPGAELGTTRRATMRYVGQGHDIMVELPEHDLDAGAADDLRARFERTYAGLFRRSIPHLDIEVLSWVLKLGVAEAPVTPYERPRSLSAPSARGARPVYDADMARRIAHTVYAREDCRPGTRLSGPAILIEKDTSILVPPRFNARVDAAGAVILEDQQAAGATS